VPALVFGLPLHVLVVHAVVVLVPLAVLGAIVVAVWPAARRRFGWLVVGVTVVAAICIPIATSSGENLRDRVTPTELIREHAALGVQLLVFVAALLVVLVATVWFGTRKAPKFVLPVLIVLTVGLAVTSAVQVARIGDSGARAAWSGVASTAP
jgi:hypothetical protein